jgi:deoxyuridine 5'-triphosphate nucleotidohydrolase
MSDATFDSINTEGKAYLIGCIGGYPKIQFEKNEEYLKIFKNLNDDLKWPFIRGFFDKKGSIVLIKYFDNDCPECYIDSNCIDLLQLIGEVSEIPFNVDKDQLRYTGTNAIDFLGKIYNDCGDYKFEKKYNSFIKLLSWSPFHLHSGIITKLPLCKILKTDSNAILPSKTKESDVGYDLSIIKVAKKLSNMVTLFDTGIKISVEHGYYAEVVPRSSISKSGYILANSIGIIDRAYSGNILVALLKVDPDAPEITLPFRCCQLIFRPQIHMHIKEVTESFDETSRNEGGFGSTGV